MPASNISSDGLLATPLMKRACGIGPRSARDRPEIGTRSARDRARGADLRRGDKVRGHEPILRGHARKDGGVRSRHVAELVR